MVPGGTPLTGLRATPAAIAFSSDSKRLAVAGLGATVELFDVATMRHAGPSVPLGSPALSTAFSPDGKMLAVGGTQGDLYLVDLPSGRRRGPLPLQYTVFNEAFSPDGRRLVATTSGGTATVYDHLRRDEPRATPLPEGRGVTAAQFSPDGSLLVTGTIDGNLQLRDGRTLRPLRPLIPTNQSPVVGIAVTRDGRLLAASDLLGTLRLVDVPSRQPIGDAFVGAGVYHSFRPDGRILATSVDGAPALMTLDIAEWRVDACKLAGRNLTPAESRKYLGTAHRRVVACPGAPTPR